MYNTFIFCIYVEPDKSNHKQPTSFGNNTIQTNGTKLISELRQLHSRMCNLLDVINSTKLIDDDSFTNQMLPIAGQMFEIQKNLRKHQFDEVDLKVKLKMADDEIDLVKYFYFETNRLISMFISPQLDT